MSLRDMAIDTIVTDMQDKEVESRKWYAELIAEFSLNAIANSREVYNKLVAIFHALETDEEDCDGSCTRYAHAVRANLKRWSDAN